MRIRSGYSFRTAVGQIPEVVSRVKEIGWSCAPLADRDSTFGFVEHTKECETSGLRPIYGVELGVIPSLGEKKPALDYWTFYATDELRPLNDLITLATNNPGKKPSLLYSQAMEAKGVIKIAGENVRLATNQEDVQDLFLQHAVPAEDLYIALSPGLPKYIFNSAKRFGFKFVASSHVFFPRSGDQELYRILMGSLRSDNRSYPQYIMNADEWTSSVSWFTNEEERSMASANLEMLLDMCRANLRRAKLLVPEKPKTLERMCIEGAERLGVDLTNDVYCERLKRELRIIKEKSFEDYFYILADVVSYARSVMIVGPARGSSAGSLVCYLLGITSIDPVVHNLIFERFVDVTRDDLPDVDIDFSDAKRHMAFEYMEKKYGSERVARLGSVTQYKSKSALDAIGVPLRIPQWMIEKVAEGSIKRAMGDSRASSTIEDTLKDTEAGQELLKAFPEAIIVARMENHPTNASQHAAGMIVTDGPVTEVVAVNAKTRAAMCDKKDAEALGILKIDALGLTQLSIFERTLELIGEKPVSGWLEKLPLDDARAFEVLNQGKFSGVFQFVGSASQGVIRQITVESFEDLVAVAALARPGPLASGGTDTWIRRRRGTERVTYPHEVFRPFLEDTLGIPIYQEQVLRIGRDVGGLSWEEVTKLRQAMSRSLGKEYFDQFGDKFKANAHEKGIPMDVLTEFWNDLCQFGAWAFNRSHSVAYAMVGYWCCWLKAHYPLEFAAATLDSVTTPEKQIIILRELREEGVDYKPFDLNLSTDRWEPAPPEEGSNKRTLIGPLTNIENIGPVKMMKILDARRRGGPMPVTIEKWMKNAKTKIDSLEPIKNAFEKKYPNLDQANFKTPLLPVIEVQPGSQSGNFLITGLVKRLIPTDENEPVRVAKRGGKRLPEPSKSLILIMRDDTDEILCKIDRRDYERIGTKMVKEGGEEDAIWTIMGTCPPHFRMIWVKEVKYIGRMKENDRRRSKATVQEASA